VAKFCIGLMRVSFCLQLELVHGPDALYCSEIMVMTSPKYVKGRQEATNSDLKLRSIHTDDGGI
jgi:hypothetical protein